MEILQLALLQPDMAVLDETDSGLDIDALRTVAEGVNTLRRPRHGRPDHHPLPADPAPGEARLRPRHVRGADRQGGRPGARRRSSRSKGYGWIREEVEAAPDRRRRLAPIMAVTSDKATADGDRSARVERIRESFPTLSRRIGDESRSPTSTAAPARSGSSPRSRRSTATSAVITRTSIAARTRCRPRRRPPTRARGRPSPTTSARPTDARSSSSATRPRRSTSSPGPGARPTSHAGDRIVLTEMEHHSNIVPWQQLADALRRRDRLGRRSTTTASC